MYIIIKIIKSKYIIQMLVFSSIKKLPTPPITDGITSEAAPINAEVAPRLVRWLDMVR